MNVGSNNLTINSGGAVTQTGSITAAGLALLGSATFTLTNAANDIDTIAAATTGSVNYSDADDLHVGVVGSTTGIATGNPGPGAAVTLSALGQITVDQLIDTSTGTGVRSASVGMWC